MAFGDGKEGGHSGGAEKFKCVQWGNQCCGFTTLKMCKKSWNTGAIPWESASYEKEV